MCLQTKAWLWQWHTVVLWNCQTATLSWRCSSQYPNALKSKIRFVHNWDTPLFSSTVRIWLSFWILMCIISVWTQYVPITPLWICVYFEYLYRISMTWSIFVLTQPTHRKHFCCWGVPHVRLYPEHSTYGLLLLYTLQHWNIAMEKPLTEHYIHSHSNETNVPSLWHSLGLCLLAPELQPDWSVAKKRCLHHSWLFWR